MKEDVQNLVIKKKYRAEKEDKADEKTGKCFSFDVVKITGDPFLSKKVEKKFINSIVGRCVTADDIGLVIKNISDFYINDGQISTKSIYSTTRSNQRYF